MMSLLLTPCSSMEAGSKHRSLVGAVQQRGKAGFSFSPASFDLKELRLLLLFFWVCFFLWGGCFLFTKMSSGTQAEPLRSSHFFPLLPLSAQYVNTVKITVKNGTQTLSFSRHHPSLPLQLWFVFESDAKLDLMGLPGE